jgi:hypothetical protein
MKPPSDPGNMAGTETNDRILRAKYLDWCSARVAERFLALTPDEIYQLAEAATHGTPVLADPGASLSSFFAPEHELAWHEGLDPNTATTDTEPFRALVAKVTEVLADRIALPTFEEWSAAYQESPQDFDGDLLGFWREDAQ